MDMIHTHYMLKILLTSLNQVIINKTCILRTHHFTLGLSIALKSIMRRSIMMEQSCDAWGEARGCWGFQSLGA